MKRLLILVVVAFTAFQSVSAQRVSQEQDPKILGFSPNRLAFLDQRMDDFIQKKQLQGAVVYVARHNEAVRFRAYGMMDLENKVPMRTDALFRIASMSKAVTTVGIMMLYERGLLQLNDPLEKYIPAFKNMKVAVAPPSGSPDSVKFVTVPAKSPITIRQLLTHTSGLGYGWGVGKEAWQKAGIQGWYFANRNEPLADVINRIGALPLEFQPGDKFGYGYSTDVLGRVIEVVSGLPLDQYFQRFIFDPLKMKDTGFWVDEARKNRLAPVYGLYDGVLKLEENNANSDYLKGPKKCMSGGAGLVSTAQDYGRLLQMFLNGGNLEGADILSPHTIEIMAMNQTGDLYLKNGNGEGFGFGFWTKEQIGANGQLSTKGAYGWGSAYYPVYFVDPKADMFGFYLTQLKPAGNLNLNTLFGTLVYQALTE